MPYCGGLFWTLPYELTNFGHDIYEGFFGPFWYLEQSRKNFFFHFFKIHRGDPYNYDQNCKGPPYEFWKNEKKIFFLDYSIDQNGHKNH